VGAGLPANNAAKSFARKARSHGQRRTTAT